MELSGVVLRPSPCFSGVGFDSQSSKLSFSSMPKNGGDLRLSDQVGLRSRKLPIRVSSLGFSDSGHVQYYVSPKAGIKEREKKQRKNSESKTLKKKMKLVKGMSKNLLRFSSMGFTLEDGLIGEVKGKSISEATEILLAQLQQLKAEEKELKRRKKEEKAKLSESSSNSSESSDSEGGEAVDMSSLRAGAIAEAAPSVQAISALPDVIDDRINLSAAASTSCRSENSVMVAGSAGKIEICMGGKCKKSGAPALLEEFQQRVGIEGAVVGCKCMGKCRDAPNVRIVNQMETQSNPLCLGVGLDDVGVIVSSFFGGESKELGLMVA